jgi:hypothetical protein
MEHLATDWLGHFGWLIHQLLLAERERELRWLSQACASRSLGVA